LVKKYAVDYHSRSQEDSRTREFASRSEAVKWARAFVAEGVQGEATAVVYEIGNYVNLARYDNVNGKVVSLNP